MFIKESHVSLQRGMSKLYLETNSNTDRPIQKYLSCACEVDVKKVNMSSFQKEQNSQGWVNWG